MRALVIHCHPDPASFTAAVRDVILSRLHAAGAEVRLTDLYASRFQPVLTCKEWQDYAEPPGTASPVAAMVQDLRWCDTLIFVYPTWWHGLPALLKGWLDRVLLPGVAFHLPAVPGGPVSPGLRHITRIAVFTSGGASRLVAFVMGNPGKRTLLRGLGALCAPGRRTAFAALYRIDGSAPATRARHLTRVARKVDRLMRGG